MSQEREMLQELTMPTQSEVERALLRSLFNNNGTIKEFSASEKIVEDLANEFGLNERQRTANLETIYTKENRVKKSNLWHRLLFRAADSLAKEKLVSRPTQTMHITNKKEWMLTENGYDRALEILGVPLAQKEIMPIRSFEVQKIVNRIRQQERPENYNPFESKKTVNITQKTKLRSRAFKQAVREAYNFKCAVCGLKICSPNALLWEVEAAHIVPHRANGRDDILNGLALCRLHHWAFDVGWFTLEDNYRIVVSRRTKDLPSDFGKLGNYDLIRQLSKESLQISLPTEQDFYPHLTAIKWHRENIFGH